MLNRMVHIKYKKKFRLVAWASHRGLIKCTNTPAPDYTASLLLFDLQSGALTELRSGDGEYYGLTWKRMQYWLVTLASATRIF
jgi:hypothetical protein